MIDCLIIGHNEPDLRTYVDTVRAIGTSKGAYRDLNLAFLSHGGQPYTCMDLVDAANAGGAERRRFSNVDFLWPVVTYLYTFLRRRDLAVDYVNLFQQEKERLIARL